MPQNNQQTAKRKSYKPKRPKPKPNIPTMILFTPQTHLEKFTVQKENSLTAFKKLHCDKELKDICLKYKVSTQNEKVNRMYLTSIERELNDRQKKEIVRQVDLQQELIESAAKKRKKRSMHLYSRQGARQSRSILNAHTTKLNYQNRSSHLKNRRISTSHLNKRRNNSYQSGLKQQPLRGSPMFQTPMKHENDSSAATDHYWNPESTNRHQYSDLQTTASQFVASPNVFKDISYREKVKSSKMQLRPSEFLDQFVPHHLSTGKKSKKKRKRRNKSSSFKASSSALKSKALKQLESGSKFLEKHQNSGVKSNQRKNKSLNTRKSHLKHNSTVSKKLEFNIQNDNQKQSSKSFSTIDHQHPHKTKKAKSQNYMTQELGHGRKSVKYWFKRLNKKVMVPICKEDSNREIHYKQQNNINFLKEKFMFIKQELKNKQGYRYDEVETNKDISNTIRKGQFNQMEINLNDHEVKKIIEKDDLAFQFSPDELIRQFNDHRKRNQYKEDKRLKDLKTFNKK